MAADCPLCTPYYGRDGMAHFTSPADPGAHLGTTTGACMDAFPVLARHCVLSIHA